MKHRVAKRFVTWSAALNLLVYILGCSGSCHADPYADYLNSFFSSSTGQQLPSMPSPQTNAWNTVNVAQNVRQKTWALVSVKSAVSSTVKSTLQSQLLTEINYVLSQQTSGRWWSSGATGVTGDSNVDRFILSEMLSAFWLLKQGGYFASQMPGWLSSVQAAVNFQYNNYGQRIPYDGDTFSMAGYYPNMDAAYILSMGAAGLLYSNTSYTTSAQQFVASMQTNCLLTGGSMEYLDGWTAIGGYTGLVIDWLSRYVTITGDTTARSVLVAMEPWYPRTISEAGFLDNSSTPWWKHQGVLVALPGYLDVISGMTSSVQNRYLAQRLIDLGFMSVPDAVAASDYWRDGVTTTAPLNNVMLADSDIGGVRGRFGYFTWVGALNGQRDTLVGAQFLSADFMPNAGFELIGTNSVPVGYNFLVAQGTPVMALDSAVVHTGFESVSITGDGSSRGAIENRIFVKGGTTYQLQVWYRTSGSISASAILTRLMAYRVAGSVLETDKVVLTGLTASGCSFQSVGNNLHVVASQTSPSGWTSLTATFTTPATAVQLCLDAFNWLGNGTVWFDDLSLKDLTAGDRAVSCAGTLISVTPEVGLTALDESVPLPNRAAYVSGSDAHSSFLLAATQELSVLACRYSPRVPTITLPSQAQGASTNWQVNQLWLGLSNQLAGRLTMTSTQAQSGHYVRMRVRTGGRGTLRASDATTFSNSALTIKLLGNNFPSVSIGGADLSDWITSPLPNADELFLEESNPETVAHSYTSGQTYDVGIDIHAAGVSDPSGYVTLTNGNLTGFRIASAGNSYDLWFNPTSTAQSLNYGLPTSASLVRRNLFVSGTVPASPTILSTQTVSTTIPAWGVAGVLVSQNLMPNPSLEQPNGTGVAGYGFSIAQGSPTMTVDSTLSHTGSISVQIAGNGSARGSLQNRVTVNGNKTYQLKVWYHTDSTIAASAVLTRLMAFKVFNSTLETEKAPLTILTATGCTFQAQGNNILVVASQTSPTSWTCYTSTFKTASNAIQLCLDSFNYLGNGSVWFDDFSLVQLD